VEGGDVVSILDADLYARGTETLVASWREYARGASGAAVHELPGVATGVFPNQPERSVYNNALLGRGLGRTERAAALDAMESEYADARVTRFAAWVHESDGGLRADLERRGYAVGTTTRAMAMPLDEARLPAPSVAPAPAAWGEHLRVVGVPPDFLSAADPGAYRVLVARLDSESAATAMAFDHRGDAGIYNVGTLEHARRRGLASALTLAHLHAALARGCLTASLQATAMAERLYAAVGFRDLGRILEYVPAGAQRA
jgi:ribosomal protein S18 acetylase RimI-like enzyme